MTLSPSDIDCKAEPILPVHVKDLPSPEGSTSDSKPQPATWLKRYLKPRIGRPLLYFGVFGLVAVLLTLILGWRLIPASVPIVTLPQGRFQGIIINRPNFPQPVEAHLGIPYALPPVGELRFARPRPVLASNATFDASRFGSRCPGKPLIPLPPGGDNGNEDCLTVNVFRPTLSSEDDYEAFNLLPVMVYFHGGAFNRGAAKAHDTASMVAYAAPFVAVTFNYRLGALGFLNSMAAAEEGILNLGLHDQVLLLEWVQENIAAFGGDPTQVTIMGLSAGAHSVGHHLLNAKSVFHRAILESGGPYSRALHHYNSSLNTQQSTLFTSLVGCANDDIACLRGIDATKLVNASDTVFEQWNPSLRWAWQPVIDSELVPGRPLDQRPPRNIPILTGFSTNEGSLYVPRNLSTDREFDTFFDTLLPQVAPARGNGSQSIASVYPASEYVEWRSVGKEFRRLEAAYGQYAYSCAVRQTAEVFSSSSDGTNTNTNTNTTSTTNTNTKTPAPAPVYLFHWAVNRTLLGGAAHGDYVAYETMDANVRAISTTQREIATLFHGYITNFIVSGNPNSDSDDNSDTSGPHGAPRWLPVQNGTKTLVFGLGNDERAGGVDPGVAAQFVRDTWATEQCAFWRGLSRRYED